MWRYIVLFLFINGCFLALLSVHAEGCDEDDDGCIVVEGQRIEVQYWGSALSGSLMRELGGSSEAYSDSGGSLFIKSIT